MEELLKLSLCEGVFKRRYKRFLADVSLNHALHTVHCPNTGAMRDLLVEGCTAYLSFNPNPKRKYAYTLEALCQGETIVGVNTHLPNKIVHAALKKRLLSPFSMFDNVRPEVPDIKGVRFDFLLSGATGTCVVEVKNVHYKEGQTALFPDSPTLRGVKHLEVLTQKVRHGARAAVVYVVQRDDCSAFNTCEVFDPLYAQKACEAAGAGVEMYAFSVSVRKNGVFFARMLDMRLQKAQCAPKGASDSTPGFCMKSKSGEKSA